ncbi:putative mediator of RNA polymerase II transcription subunit 26 isoform X3 [Leptopilina boulardi]|uniref:putative mediator of RNA polymerase II transcription subunit 26 isoform X3 n=1 Tax=Leptopilina boulardi TaxID=63433 RepID=UPI0021F5BAFD|nr:putative mediator of RNA polymerase II transcription subunit 26 isoform X3 [Leptopilina boulardi]
MARPRFDYDEMDFQFGLRYRDVTDNEKGIVRGATNDNKGATKRGMPYTRGTAMSFGFRRRPTTGIPVPVTNYNAESSVIHQRSKSAGAEHDRRRDDNYQQGKTQTSSSGRSTPRLAPPKKESSGLNIRTNRFGFRHTQAKFTDKVSDVCTSHLNQDKHVTQQPSIQQQQQQQQQLQQHDNYNLRQSRSPHAGPPITKPRPSPVNHPSYNNNHLLQNDRKISGIPEPVSKYTLHTSHLPLPQYAIRVSDSNSKIAKTVANQSRKVSTNSRGCSSSKDGSGTEDSGVGSHHGYSDEPDMARGLDIIDSSSAASNRRHVRPRNLRMVVSGKSFDVRDVDDDSTVTEISVIPLPKSFATPNINTGLVRERTTHYQRILNKDNRYTESTTSMSTTSSEGYDDGLEEKVYKDRSHSEKIPSIKSDFSPPSSDDPEYGHGEAMADEYSFSSSDECQRINSTEHLKTISNAAKNGTLPKNALRSVLLTIEDPAFAAVAATATALIDDETSPVDSLFDSPTVSITQSDGKTKKEGDKSLNGVDDDSPGTPTNASNSLSLSEGREFFDDEIEDQPGLIFDDTGRVPIENRSRTSSQAHTENSQTLIESTPKTVLIQPKSVENSPMRMRRVTRAGSIDTLSSCESIASDDLMLDYERSEASSYGDTTLRIHSSHNDEDVNELLDLEVQSQEVMREWTSLLGAHHINTTNNNANLGINNNNPTTDTGITNSRTTRLLRNRSGADSPKSLDSTRSRQVFSPLRPPRNVQSPGLDSGDEGSLRLERGTYQHMFQDIVSIKTMLLKLKRVLQESGENGLTRAETLNPFDNSLKNGLFYNLNEDGATDDNTNASNVKDKDEIVDLRRQVIFLQGQVDDKERTIQLLQLQMTKHQGVNGVDPQVKYSLNQCRAKETCNAATQTEKIRPVSAGPALLQSLPQDGNMGPLVSWSDLGIQQNGSLIPEFNDNKLQKSSTVRMLRSSKEFAAHRTIGYPVTNNYGSNKTSSIDNSTIKSVVSENIIKNCPIKIESTSIKSSIPTTRRLATPTLIPRVARAVSATGRLSTLDLGVNYTNYNSPSTNLKNSISFTSKIN